MVKRIKRLKTLLDYRKALMKYYLNYYSSFTIFGLQKKLLEKGVCPYCGKISHRWSSREGYFPCGECGFNITENELYKVYDKEKSSPILKRRLKEVKNGKIRRKSARL
jgi:ribosomal protein L37AE/L43A